MLVILASTLHEENRAGGTGFDGEQTKRESGGSNSSQNTQNEPEKPLGRHGRGRGPGRGDNGYCLRTQCVLEHKVSVSATCRFV